MAVEDKENNCYVSISMKRAKYVKMKGFDLRAIIVKILVYIQKHKHLVKNTIKIFAYFSSIFYSLSLTGKISCSQQNILLSVDDVDSLCDSRKCDDLQAECISSKADNESYDLITNNPNNIYIFNIDRYLQYVKYALKIKQVKDSYESGVRKPEVVLQEDMVGHAGLKVDNSEHYLPAQIVPDSVSEAPRSGNGSSSSGSGSSSSGNGSTSSGSESTSSGSESTSSGSESTSSGSESTSSGSESSSSGSESTSSGSESTSSGSESTSSGSGSSSSGSGSSSSGSGSTSSGSESTSSGSESTSSGSESSSSGSESTSSGSESTSSGSESSSSGSESSSSGSGSSSSGSGSTSSGSGTLSSGSESTGSGSGTPSSGSGSTSFGSESASVRSGSTSSGSGSTRSDLSEPSHAVLCSGKEQLSECTKETASENSNILGSDLSLTVQTEHETVCEEDVALGTNCPYELHLATGIESGTQVLPSIIQDIFNAPNNEIGKQNPINLRRPVIDDPSSENVCEKFILKICKGELILETSINERKLSGFQDHSLLGHSDIPGKCTSMWPDVCSQSRLNYQFKAIDGNIVPRSSLLQIIMNEDCEKYNESSETEDVECLIGPVDESEKSEVGEITESVKCLIGPVGESEKSEVGEITESVKCLIGPVGESEKSEVGEITEGVKCLIGPVDESEKSEVGEITESVKCLIGPVDDSELGEVGEITEDVTCLIGPVNESEKSEIGEINDDVECFVEPVGESEKSEVKEINQDKCHLAAYINKYCDKDNQWSGTEFGIEPFVNCKKSKVELAAEQAIQGNTSKNKNNDTVLKNGKYCKKQQAENFHLKINNEMSESLSQRTQHLSDVTQFYESFPSAPFATDLFELFIQSIPNAELGRDTQAASSERCNCRYPHRCFHNKTVSTFITVESGGQHQEHPFGLRSPMKFDPSKHMPWRYNNYVFNQATSFASNSLYIFMDFEVFRLSSFDFKKFPKDDSSFVTLLARSGFYFTRQSEQIICFQCGSKYERSQDSSPTSADTFHNPQCTRHISNKPIHQWMHRVNLHALTEYFMQNGSLMPYIEETSPAVGKTSSRRATAKKPLEAKPVSDLQSCTDDFSSGYESDGLQYVQSERETHSDSLLFLIDSSLRDIYVGPSSNHTGSLPSNLNQISGVVVSEERSQTEQSHSVLTSATRRPLLYTSTRSSNADHGNDAAEEGAVGGTLTFNLDGASYPHFSIEAVRMTSFTVWSPQHTHKPEDLAAAGFFYAGYSDCVRCFYCGLGLKYWRPTDIPAYQHAKYRPHCRFNILYKGQEYVDEVQQELLSVQGATNRIEALPASMQPQANVQTTTTSQVSRSPQVQDYMGSEAAKDALRNGWTRDQVQQAVSHIVSVYGASCLEAELLTDILTHFNTLDEPSQGLPRNTSFAGSIDSGIRSTVSQLTTSPPSSATLVNASSVPDDGEDRHQADQRTQEGAAAVSASRGEQPGVRTPDFMELLTSVEREHSLLEARVTCRVCKSKPVGCIYLPCGHVIACQDCADNATNCVFCRKVIVGTANIFLA